MNLVVFLYITIIVTHTQAGYIVKALEFICLFSRVDIQAAIRSVQQIRSQIRTYGFGWQPKPTASDT